MITPNWLNGAGLGKPFSSKEGGIVSDHFLSDVNTVETVYNDIGLCDTSSTASGSLWYQLILYS
jgi:hypothetical protein